MPQDTEAKPQIWLEHVSGQLQGARARQEDACLIQHVDDRFVALVADGLGGHPAGDEASRIGSATAGAYLLSWLGQARAGAQAPLRSAFGVADRAVRKLRQPQLHERPPATTLVGGVFFPAELRFDAANVGDSLALLLRNDELSSLFKPQGRGNCVDHALGTGLPGKIEMVVDTLEPGLILRVGDRILLSSDGIGVLTQPVIAAALSQERAREAVEVLLKAVIDCREPMQDNCTVVVIAVHASPAPAGTPADETIFS